MLRLALGVGQSVAFPASASAVSRAFRDRERGMVTASYLSGVRVGQALVGAIGAAMIATLGYRGFFLAVGLVPLVWLWPWLRFWSKRADGTTTPGGGAPAARPFSLLSGIALLKQRSVLGIVLGYFAYDYVWFVYVTWLPSYLVMGRKFSTGEMALYSSMPYLVMMGVILVSGAASDWLVRRGWPERTVRQGFHRDRNARSPAWSCRRGIVEDRDDERLAADGRARRPRHRVAEHVDADPDRLLAPHRRHGLGLQNFGGNLGGIVAPALTGYTVPATGSFVLAFSVCRAVLVAGVLCYLLTRLLRPSRFPSTTAEGVAGFQPIHTSIRPRFCTGSQPTSTFGARGHPVRLTSGISDGR